MNSNITQMNEPASVFPNKEAIAAGVSDKGPDDMIIDAELTRRPHLKKLKSKRKLLVLASPNDPRSFGNKELITDSQRDLAARIRNSIAGESQTKSNKFLITSWSKLKGGGSSRNLRNVSNRSSSPPKERKLVRSGSMTTQGNSGCMIYSDLPESSKIRKIKSYRMSISY